MEEWRQWGTQLTLEGFTLRHVRFLWQTWKPRWQQLILRNLCVNFHLLRNRIALRCRSAESVDCRTDLSSNQLTNWLTTCTTWSSQVPSFTFILQSVIQVATQRADETLFFFYLKRSWEQLLVISSCVLACAPRVSPCASAFGFVVVWTVLDIGPAKSFWFLCANQTFL